MENAQQALDRLCAARGIPGAVFGVVDDGVVTVAVYGTANLNTGLPVVRETLFQAGSIGKSYTATAIMQLVDDGRLDLDAPLREYLPDLEFADATVSKTLTSRQVLTPHRRHRRRPARRGLLVRARRRLRAALRRRPHRPAADHRTGRAVVVLQQRLHRPRPGHRGAHRDDVRAGDHHAASSNRSASRTRCSSPATW